MQRVRCDVVKCTHNQNCECSANKVEISLTHDEMSEKEYIKCSSMIVKTIKDEGEI